MSAFCPGEMPVQSETSAGVPVSRERVPAELKAHMALYERIGQMLGEKFGIVVPAPFASTTIDAAVQAQMGFVRGYLRQLNG